MSEQHDDPYLQELHSAAVLFAKLDGETDEGGGRLGAMFALKATVDFIGRLTGNDPVIQEPLYRLLAALLDAEKGVAHRMLRPIKIGKKAPISLNERTQRGYLAAAMEYLMWGGMERDEAAKWVARHAGGFGAFDRIRTDHPWRAVRDWRDAASEGNPTEDADAVILRTVQTTLDARTQSSCFVPEYWQRAARGMISRARNFGNPKTL